MENLDFKERRCEMLEMLKRGCTYREIGDAFNISRQRAFQILNSKEVETTQTEIVDEKTELVRAIFSDLHQEIQSALESNYKARQERNKNRKWQRINDDFINTINGKIDALRGIEGFIDGLEKKYTESEDNV